MYDPFPFVNKEERDNTIIVSSCSSRCGKCGKPTWMGKTHDKIVGYGDDNGSPGCGTEFIYAYSEYAYDEGMADRLAARYPEYKWRIPSFFDGVGKVLEYD